MAYTKTEWISNETALSAEHMNNIEDGIKNLENSVGTWSPIETIVQNDYWTITGYYNQILKIGCINVQGTSTSVPASNYSYSLPQKLIPKHSLTSPLKVNNSDGYMYIRIDGQIDIILSNTTPWVAGHVTYILP